MQQTLTFHDSPVSIHLSPAAVAAAAALHTPIILEMQLYFSCVLVKRMAIYARDPLPGTMQLEAAAFDELMLSSQPLTERLLVNFHTVMTSVCLVSDYAGPPPLTDFEISNKSAYVPRWLNIDYRDGMWFGYYGWSETDKRNSGTVQIREA